MRNKIINRCMNLIKNNSDLDDIKLAEVKYGLEGVYMTLTKLVIVVTIALLLGILKEVIIFLFLYNIIRMPSFGLHATKSWICLVSTLIVFLTIPYLCKVYTIPNLIKIIMGIVLILLYFKNAPADTHKRPIVSIKRRRTYKVISTLLAIIFVILSLIIENRFLSNSLIMALVVQSFIISPTIYKLFNLPYDNYKNYQSNMVWIWKHI